MTKNDFAMKHVIGLIDVIDVELKERRVKSYDLDALHGKRDPQNQNWYKKKKRSNGTLSVEKVNSVQTVKGKLVKGWIKQWLAISSTNSTSEGIVIYLARAAITSPFPLWIMTPFPTSLVSMNKAPS